MINPLVHRAEYLVVMGPAPTVLCPTHAKDFAVTAQLLDIVPEIYQLDPEEEPIVCQTCYLLDTNSGIQKSSH